jgi:hypothetical protein
VAAQNDIPVATGETAATAEDTSIVFTQAQLLANDSDVDMATDGQTLSISAVSGAQNGTVTLLANGDIQFTPNANYHGQAKFTYTVTDSSGGKADAVVNLKVLGVNDTPVLASEMITAASGAALGLEDTALAIAASTLLVNDTDVDAEENLGVSPNIWGLTPTESQVLQATNQSATGSVPNWLGRVAERPKGVRASGLCGLQAANDAAWRIVA